jgi:sulfide:quinone oxidoreductase
MVKIVQLEQGVAVAPQLAEADFAAIAQLGFRSVVNNRPDGETPDQLPNAEAAAEARMNGLNYCYQPVHSVDVTDDDVVAAFARLVDDLPGPILFYCGTGTRCAVLWTQAEAGRRDVDEVLAVARNAGFDLDFLRDTLTERGEWRVTAASVAPTSLVPTSLVPTSSAPVPVPQSLSGCSLAASEIVGCCDSV